MLQNTVADGTAAANAQPRRFSVGAYVDGGTNTSVGAYTTLDEIPDEIVQKIANGEYFVTIYYGSGNKLKLNISGYDILFYCGDF